MFASACGLAASQVASDLPQSQGFTMQIMVNGLFWVNLLGYLDVFGDFGSVFLIYLSETKPFLGIFGHLLDSYFWNGLKPQTSYEYSSDRSTGIPGIDP